MKELVLYKAEIDPALDSDIEVNYVALVDRPAIEKHFLAFKAQEQTHKNKFILNEEKRIISGPAMIADLPIYRNDNGKEYYVLFDKSAIQQIAEKFAAKGYMKNINLFHDEKQTTENVTIFNSFVTDKELGILPMQGFEDIADGSWFLSCKVNDDKIWQDVKDGKILGYSIEGLFTYVPTAKLIMTAQELKDTINVSELKMSAEELLEIVELLTVKAIITD